MVLRVGGWWFDINYADHSDYMVAEDKYRFLVPIFLLEYLTLDPCCSV
jgi:hypothetical protein